MDWAGWGLFGLLSTSALTLVMIAAQMAGFTRLDLPLVLGTLLTDDPDRARLMLRSRRLGVEVIPVYLGFLLPGALPDPFAG